MGEAAVRLALAVGYVNAGTIEFLMDADGNYYFIEMNTRLQVEHPVTEQTTGIDIVQTMLKVAAGEPLPFSQAEIKTSGHAIEARITAEDSEKNFAPSCGKVTTWKTPVRDDVRMETHVYEGFTIAPFYDPMIAKLIVTGSDRQDAIDRLRTALQEMQVGGIKTNIPFIQRLIEEPAFQSGDFHTGTVPELMKRWHGA